MSGQNIRMMASRGRRRKRSAASVVRGVVSVAVLALALWLFLPHILPMFKSDREEVDPTASESLRRLSELEVGPDSAAEEAPPYSRDQFGEGWADLDGDGCNTRNEILARDLDQVAYRDGTSDCVVESGILQDPYTGQAIQFERGEQTSAMVQIDHVVALADAWQAGAWQWESDQRLEFANDPDNLLAVDGTENQRKGASTAERWMPSDEAAWCDYAARQVDVKYKWALTVSAAERDQLNSVLSECAAQASNGGGTG